MSDRELEAQEAQTGSGDEAEVWEKTAREAFAYDRSLEERWDEPADVKDDWRAYDRGE